MATEFNLFKANAQQLGEFVFNLKDRWRDEREYEDFNDYFRAIKNAFAKRGLKVLHVNKRFDVKCETGTFKFIANGAISFHPH